MTSQTKYNTTENESQQSPIDLVLSRLPGAKFSGRSYKACCPAHNDKSPSLEIWEDDKDGHVGLMCYAGCQRKAICGALSIEEADLYRNDTQFEPRTPREKIDLTDLARDKIIPFVFLSNLGLVETKRGDIRMPYYTMEGREYSHARIRTALKAVNGTVWEKGATAIPYGLDRLAAATDYLTIVEGESDCWTLWLHGLPALGIPGANMYNKIQPEHIASFPNEIYIIREPGNPGNQFAQGVIKRLAELKYTGDIFRIDLKGSHDVKDPNDLHKMLHAEGRLSEFKAEWQKALDQSRPSYDEEENIDEDEGNEDEEEGDDVEYTGLPRVLLGSQLRDSRDESLKHLGDSEKEEPTIFVQSGRLVQIGRDKEHKAVIMHMGVAEMKNALTKVADFFTTRKAPNSKKVKLKHASPPKEVADAILALSPSKWPFKPLEAIVETPVIRPDGTILQDPGYDEQTRLYYAPHKDMQACNVPESPTKKEAQEALAVLQDIIADFPFVDRADYANMLALMLTPIIRPAIKRHVPLALIDAPKQGAGKGLLSDIVAIIATGESAPIMPAPKNDEEWDKKITSILMTGATIITLDNLPSRLQSSMLDAVLTADYWVGRILGVSKMVKVPHRATWVATGNNIKVGGDLARRCYRIRIDPQTSKPWTRTEFKYEDLATHVSEHRAEIITAILTLVRAWFVAGCPQDKTIPALGTFTGWARMVGSILSFAGVSGFLGNLNKLYDEMDEENTQWALFLQAWKDKFKEKEILVKELVNALTEEEEEPKQGKIFDDSTGGDTGGAENFTGGCLADFLPDYLQSALQSTKKEKKGSFNVTLGKQLEKRVDTCFGEDNLKLKKVRDKSSNTTKWSVVTGGAGGGFSPNTRDTFSSSHNEEGEKESNNAQYKDDLNHLRHLRYEEGNSNGKHATNQGEKTTEPLSNASFDDLFADTPPVQPPVNGHRPPQSTCVVHGTLKDVWSDEIGTWICGKTH